MITLLLHLYRSSSPQIVETLDVPGSVTLECPGSPLSGRLTRLGENSKGQEPVEINKYVHVQCISANVIHNNRGQIEIERPLSGRSTKSLICTHVAKGHNSGVLSLSATDTMLLSASQGLCTIIEVIVAIY